MIPLGDASRRPLHLPVATLLLVVANGLLFVLELFGGDAFVNQWSLVPAQMIAGHNPVPLLGSMFLHAGWMHILGNMLFLWVFGPEIEDVMGPLRYLLFYLLGGAVAGMAQVAIDPTSTVPILGASGAIAAVMGAFLITYPRDRIRTILLFGWFARVTFVPAVVLVGVWFLTQVLSEVGAVVDVQAGGGVAYMAHTAGFVFGALLARVFETRERRSDEGLD